MAINILPTIDPGKDIGESFGQGFGNALQMLGQREQQKNALELVKSFQPTGDFVKDYATLSQYTSGIPGLENFAQTAAPLIMQRHQAGIPLTGQPGSAQQPVQPGQQQQGPSEVNPQQEMPVQQSQPAAPRYTTLAEYEQSPRAQQLRAAGATRDQLQNDWNLQNADYQQQEQANANRVQKELLSDQTFDKNFNSWADSEGFGEGGDFAGDSQFFRDMGNSLYEKLNDTNKGENNLHNNWLETKKQLTKAKQIWQHGSNNLSGSWIHGDEWLQNGAKFAKEFKKIAGDTPEINERLITKFAKSGADLDYARQMVTPPSENTQKYLKHFPLNQTEGRNTLAGVSEESRQKKLDSWAEPFINAGKNGYSILSPDESIMLFRNNMYRKGATVEQANKVIRDIEEAGGLSEKQQQEWASNANETPSRWLLVDIMR